MREHIKILVIFKVLVIQSDFKHEIISLVLMKICNKKSLFLLQLSNQHFKNHSYHIHFQICERKFLTHLMLTIILKITNAWSAKSWMGLTKKGLLRLSWTKASFSVPIALSFFNTLTWDVIWRKQAHIQFQNFLLKLILLP